MTPSGRNFMRPALTFLFLSGFALVLGCQSQDRSGNMSDPSPRAYQEADRWMVSQPFRDQAENAVSQERVIYPGRFVSGSADLNRLGKKDISTIAQVAHSGPVMVIVRRGNVSDQLYSLRVSSVVAEFSTHGIDSSRLDISSLSSDSVGTPTTEVIRVIKEGRNSTLRPVQGEVLTPTGGSEVVR